MIIVSTIDSGAEDVVLSSARMIGALEDVMDKIVLRGKYIPVSYEIINDPINDPYTIGVSCTRGGIVQVQDEEYDEIFNTVYFLVSKINEVSTTEYFVDIDDGL